MDIKDIHSGKTAESKLFLSLLLPVQKRLYAYILYHVPNKNDSEDILQETIATMLSKFDTYQEGTNFLWWAITIAKYKILSLRQANKRIRLIFDQEDMDRIQDEAMNKSGVLDEEAKLLKTCLKKLSDKQSKFINFRYGCGMTYRQIAKQFNISMQSTYRSIARIQAALLKCIKMALQSEGLRG